ncbi:hypothetical protein [Nocardioides sp. LHG3406-4]|uniref:hypothetical protein n=1 Tax=Nocardioides sp. LHG3406-4 TaxID=2804575 RepID=UPI003CF43784
MSRNPFTVPAKPAHITLDTLPQLFAHHRARFGGVTMSQGSTEPPPPGNQPGAGDPPPANDPPTRPDGVSEDEWNGLGETGRTALTRERDARQAAERALAAARARPAPPKADPPKADPPKADPPKTDPPKAGEVDIEAIVTRAVAAAVKPFQDRDEQREAEQAAGRIQTAVLAAAKDKFHDATDALTNIDLTQVTDGNGNVDHTKVAAQFDDLIKRKPHLAKVVDDRRFAAQPGAGATPGGSTAPLDTRVKETLARMQAAAGLKVGD